MRPQPDQPRRPSRRERRARRSASGGSRFAGRGRVVLGVVLVGMFVLLVSLRGIASFYTDYLWFDSLGLGSVWGTVLGSKISLTLIGGAVFFALCWGNLLIAERMAPAFRPVSSDDDLIERYHLLVGHRAGAVRLGVTAFLAVLFGVSLGSNWNAWLLYTNRVDFGQKDATFNTDIGFYVFQLPFLTTALAWLFNAVVLVLLVSVLAHVVNGGIRFHTQLDRVTPQVKAHISVLLGALALVQAGRYWLGRYQLTFSTRGTVDGATYTDTNVELRATYLLIVIALFAFALFIANIWRRGWVLPVMAVGLWIFVAALAGGIVPAFVQRFRVEPSESSMEAPYIRNNIEATRAAYGLDVDSQDYEWTGDISVSDLATNVETLRNIRLWDPAIIKASFERQQQLKSYYEINDVDVDRYTLDGNVTPVMIAARDLATAGVQQSSWEATHLAYTHGYGVVAATANSRTSSGDPDLVARDIPVESTRGMPEVTQPGIYFGENKSGYVIVNTDRREIDYQESGNVTKFTTYDGADGVKLGSGVTGFVRQVAFALRFGDINPLVSGNIRPDSRVLIERDVTARLKAVAPFLAYDHDPYVVTLADGSVKYVVDAYTTTRNFPNAERADTGGLHADSGLRGRSFNYARNSVKAVVDAYEGTVDLYVVDAKDPIIKAYRKAFPDLFTAGSKAPEALRAHFRYPEDLFTVQTQMWARYHVTDSDTFYNGNDEWNVPPEPGGRTVKGGESTAVGADGQPLTSDDRYQSKYQLLQLPGDERASFVLLRPFVPASKGSREQNQLTAFMVASSDPGDYGTLRSYVLPADNLPDGPTTATDNIQADDAVADLRRQLCQGDSECDLATPSIVPIGDAILYVQSFFVSGTELGAPKLEQVIVHYQSGDGTEIEVDSTLRGALVKLFGDDVPTGIEDTKLTDPAEPGAGPDDGPDGGSDDGSEGEVSVSVQETRLIDRIVQAFDDADAAIRSGDLAAYADLIDKAERYARDLAELRARAERESGSTTTTAPSGSSGSTTTTTTPGSTTTTTPGTTTTTSAGA